MKSIRTKANSCPLLQAHSERLLGQPREARDFEDSVAERVLGEREIEQDTPRGARGPGRAEHHQWIVAGTFGGRDQEAKLLLGDARARLFEPALLEPRPARDVRGVEPQVLECSQEHLALSRGDRRHERSLPLWV